MDIPPRLYLNVLHNEFMMVINGDDDNDDDDNDFNHDDGPDNNDNKMPILAFTRDADSFIPIVCFAD